MPITYKIQYHNLNKNVQPQEVSISANSLSTVKRIASTKLKDYEGIKWIEIHLGRYEIAYRFTAESHWTDVFHYCDYDVIRDTVDYRLECDNPDNLTEDELWEQCYSQDWLFEDEWQYFLETISERLERVAPEHCIHIKGKNLGWRGISGEVSLDLDYNEKRSRWIHDPIDRVKYLLDSIICCSNCTIRAEANKNSLYFRITHHDNPVNGDRFTITPLTRKIYENAA